MRRVLTVFASCSVALLVVFPVGATAHGGGRRTDRHDPGRARQICAEVGAPLGARSIYGHLGYAPKSKLSEAQIQALQVACKKLASTYTTEHEADQAAGKALQSALATALEQLQNACPRDSRHHHYEDGSGSLYPIPPACKEARKAYDAAVRSAEETFRDAQKEVAQKLRAALEEFEATAQSVLSAAGSGAGGGDRHRHHRDGRRGRH